MILWTQKAANEKITGLEAELKTAAADLVAANEARTTAESRVGELEREAAEHTSQIQTRDERITELEAKLSAAEANVITAEVVEAKALALVSAEAPPAAVQKVIAARVTESLAAAGAATPIESADAPAKNETAKTLTTDEFNALTPAEKSKFSVNGGRISNPS